jgi:hypothetical protein
LADGNSLTLTVRPLEAAFFQTFIVKPETIMIPFEKFNLILLAVAKNKFLIANGDSNLSNYMHTIDRIEPIPEAFFNPLYEKLKMHFV